MDADADLAAVAGLIGEPARAGFLLSLLEGRPLRAGDLAARSRVSPSLASMHLRKLHDGGLIEVAQEGRERRYRISTPAVARAVESLLRIAPGRPARSLRESQRGEALRAGRTCYDHLAGHLGVALTEAMGEQRVLRPLDGSYRLTRPGRARLEGLGVDVAAAEAGRRSFARQCLDWTERRPHLAGALGAAVADRLFELRWLERREGTRAVRLTPAGQRCLHEEFGLELA
jgi:DNA-binding transcriptional ArsR family regulator